MRLVFKIATVRQLATSEFALRAQAIARQDSGQRDPPRLGRRAARSPKRYAPTAETIVLVMDNRNIHSPASLYKAFPPAEARRLGDQATLTTEVASWVAARNVADRRIDWRCTTADARNKLKRLYPTLA